MDDYCAGVLSMAVTPCHFSFVRSWLV